MRQKRGDLATRVRGRERAAARRRARRLARGLNAARVGALRHGRAQVEQDVAEREASDDCGEELRLVRHRNQHQGVRQRRLRRKQREVNS